MAVLNERISLFLDSVCGYINCKAVHEDIRNELSSHINELKESYIEEGQAEESAVDMAILAMGGSDKIGKRLNNQHKPQTEWSLVVLTAIIAVIGGGVMFMSSRLETQTVDFGRYLLYIIDLTTSSKKAKLLHRAQKENRTSFGSGHSPNIKGY